MSVDGMCDRIVRFDNLLTSGDNVLLMLSCFRHLLSPVDVVATLVVKCNAEDMM